MNKSFIVTLFSALILSISVDAWATPPSSEVYDSYEDFGIVGCGDYHIRTAADLRIRETFFFDKDGVPVRLRISVLITGSIYYSIYNESDPADPESIEKYIQQGAKGVGENQQIWIDLTEIGEKYTGLPFRITLPGIGPLFLEAGHGYWDGVTYTFHGISIMPEDGTGSALCEALAP
jgi:hypothetical protein